MLKLSETSSIGMPRIAASMARCACRLRRARAASSAWTRSSSAKGPARPSDSKAWVCAWRFTRSNRAGCAAWIASICLAILAAMRSFQNVFSVTVRPGMVRLLGVGMGVKSVRDAPGGSGLGDRPELVDQLAGLGQAQVLGARHVVVVAQDPRQVGVLPPRDRHDRADLARRRRLRGPAARPIGPGRGMTVA